ncbi:MAG TPA: response regulator transcription factor, partial [Methylomirabilota bacterium]|nr:response regulator transcription factor [Methylomirabilota bacterium]
LVAGLFPYWFFRARFIEGRTWFERVLALPGVVPATIRVKVLHAAGGFDRIAGGLLRAEARAKEGEALARAGGDQSGRAKSLNLLAEIAEDREEHAAAAASRKPAHALFREVGDRFWMAVTTDGLGDLALVRQDINEAERRYREALALFAELGNEWGQASALKDLGQLAYRRGDFPLAASAWRESLHLNWRQHQPWHVEGRIESLAVVAAAIGDHGRAARLLGATAALSEVLGTPLPPRRRTALDPIVAVIRAELGDGFAAEWAAGRAMTIDEAVAEALLVVPVASATPAFDPARAAGLSARERDVLRLIADGRSNQAIAEAVFLSRGTVTKHVEHILNKLGVDSRVAAAAWAIRNGVA